MPILEIEDDNRAMPLYTGQASMQPDMKFGWKPEVRCSHPPIPLYFNFVEHRLHTYRFDETEESDVVIYQEKRPTDTY